jgi:hypothetical protein
MSSQVAGGSSSSLQEPPDGAARLRLAKGPLAGAVLSRVVSMLLTRAEWPVDRLHDAMLVCDALSAHAPEYTGNGVVAFELKALEGGEVQLSVEDLSPEGAEGIVRDAALPGVGNVLERIPKSVSAEPTETGSRLKLILAR